MLGSCLAMPPPTAKVTVKVVDEIGAPVAGAATGIGIGAVTSVGDNGISDANGIFIGQVTGWGGLGYGAKKTGYYSYHDVIDVHPVRSGLLYRWEPWNPTKVAVLRPIINPVPMYAKWVTATLPRLEALCGYDLELGDWVQPYGKGINSDLIFTGFREFVDRDNWKASLRVAANGKSAGFISIKEFLGVDGSDFKLPREAPLAGYLPRYDINDKSGTPDPFNKELSFVFRTRTVENAKGETITALYGKIRGPIQFGVRSSPTMTLVFTYYINPDGTRNLEFDPKRNLFQNKIPDVELVGWP